MGDGVTRSDAFTYACWDAPKTAVYPRRVFRLITGPDCSPFPSPAPGELMSLWKGQLWKCAAFLASIRANRWGNSVSLVSRQLGLPRLNTQVAFVLL